jgi:hypothetical protein
VQRHRRNGRRKTEQIETKITIALILIFENVVSEIQFKKRIANPEPRADFSSPLENSDQPIWFSVCQSIASLFASGFPLLLIIVWKWVVDHRPFFIGITLRGF